MAKAKLYQNAVRLKESDLIAKSSRASEKVMIIDAFPIMLDVLFKTSGAPLSKQELAAFEKTCKTVQGTYYKKMNDHVKGLVKSVVEFHKQDQAGKQDAATKAQAECKKAVNMLDGTLFDQMRVDLRKAVEKQISDQIKKGNSLHIKQSAETAGMSGFRNPRRAIYLAPGAFVFEQETDKAFGKAATSITKGGKALRSEGKAVATARDQALLSVARLLKQLNDYAKDDAGSTDFLKNRNDREFAAEFKQRDKGTFGKTSLDTSQLVGALEDLATQVSGVEKELKDFSKLLDPKKKKTLDPQARSRADSLTRDMGKHVKPLMTQLQSDLANAQALSRSLDEKFIASIARNNAVLGKASTPLDKSSISDKHKQLARLADGCDELKKIIDRA